MGNEARIRRVGRDKSMKTTTKTKLVDSTKPAKTSAQSNSQLHQYRLIWSLEGRTIATVTASSESKARRKAPMPYRKYLGEIAAHLVGPDGMTEMEYRMERDHMDNW